MKFKKQTMALALAGVCLAPIAQASEWSDFSVGYRYGNTFREPNNPNNIGKNIFNLTYVDRNQYGSNFLNVDMLRSTSLDPAAPGSASYSFQNPGQPGATEYYLTYRYQLQIGKAFKQDLAVGPIKDFGVTAGVDLNTKNTSVAPQKQLLVIGPTIKFDVPGVLDFSVLYAQERNHNGLASTTAQLNKPYGSIPNVSPSMTFGPQMMLNATWLIPFNAGPAPMKFQGFVNYLTQKGSDYFGNPTAPETLNRMSLMVDVGDLAANRKNTFWMGVGYEFWNNKFGNHSYSPTNANARMGIRNSTPTLNAEIHF